MNGLPLKGFVGEEWRERSDFSSDEEVEKTVLQNVQDIEEFFQN